MSIRLHGQDKVSGLITNRFQSSSDDLSDAGISRQSEYGAFSSCIPIGGTQARKSGDHYHALGRRDTFRQGLRFGYSVDQL